MELQLYEEGTTFKCEELDIIFEVPIALETVLYDGSPFENDSETHKRQCAFIEQFCPEDHQSPRVIPLDISREGITLLTKYSKEIQRVLPYLLDAMSAISGVEVKYSLQTSDTWQDVTWDFDLNVHRLMTEAELWELYPPETWYHEEPVIYM